MTPGRVVRKLAFTGVGVLLFVAGLTVVYLGMRAVMDVGGTCASGGPYQVRQECPDGAGLIVVGIFAGLVGTGLTVAGTFAGGPQLWTLAWPALFCALGWNFLEYGIDPPPPETGVVWGWLVCAVVFLAMGGVPLLFVVANAKAVLWGRDPGPASTPRAAIANLRPHARATRASAAGSGSTTEPAPTGVRAEPRAEPRAGAPVGDPDRGDLVHDLERLVALHREGALTDDEFARAKAARLAEESA